AEDSLVDADEEQHGEPLPLSVLGSTDVEEHCSDQDTEDDGLDQLGKKDHPRAHHVLHRSEEQVPHLREPRGPRGQNANAVVSLRIWTQLSRLRLLRELKGTSRGTTCPSCPSFSSSSREDRPRAGVCRAGESFRRSH